ncbi:MAG: hypothetical protein GTO14_20105 [Anaerolineales bacterium]|nr:hypothetical protein [Anaerolineales bacterium]
MKHVNKSLAARTAMQFLAIGMFLAACNRPAEEPPPDKIATYVAATLTAAPTLPASVTPPPSATPVLTPSTTPIASPTAGPSPTPPPPELSADDPRFGINLAAPHYVDDFSSQLTWFGPNFEGAINIWDNGRMRATDNLADHNIWWSTTVREIDAGYLYAEITADIGECRGKDSYGFAVRVSGDQRNSGYTIELSCDGHYRMRKFVSGSVKILVEWTPSEAIQKGPNSTNRMGILAKGSILHGIVNGEVFTPVQDNEFTQGTYGLFASAIETTGVTVYFDDFTLWFLSPE